MSHDDLSPELRRRVCRLLAGVVVTDDDLDPSEDAFIDRMLQSFGIPLEERETIFPIIDRTEAEAAMRELPASAQKRAFELLVDAAAVDGKIAAEEREYLQTVAGVVGVSNDELEQKLQARLRG